MFMITNSFAYFIFDTLIEIIYGTDDMLTNIHHAVCLTVSYFCFCAPHSGFEFLGNSHIL